MSTQLTNVESHSFADTVNRERLFHFVTSDLPAQTRPVELDDRNAAAAFHTDAVASGDRDFLKGSAVTVDLIGKYLSYMVKIGFIAPPTERGARSLPDVEITQAQLEAIKRIEGRGAVSG